MPVPSAWIRVPISAEDSILSKRARSTLRILPLSGRIAWKRRLRPCLAEPPALSPSTMNSSLLAGSRSWQSASLPGRLAMSSALLRRVRSRALRAASRAAAASTTLRDDLSGVGRVLLEPLLQRGRRPAPRSTGRTSEETSLSLVCDENFGSGSLDRQDAGQAFAHVLAGQRHLLLLGDAAVVGIGVDGAGQARRGSRRDACRRRAAGCCW